VAEEADHGVALGQPPGPQRLHEPRDLVVELRPGELGTGVDHGDAVGRGGHHGPEEDGHAVAGSQLPWKPNGTRRGRWTRATSSSVSASSTTTELSSAPRSWTQLRIQP